MQNIDVRFSATSNFARVERDLATLTAQAEALGAMLKRNATVQPGSGMMVDPSRWKIASRAVHEASAEFRNAASSSGLFTTQQIRATSEAEKFTKALQRQKLSFGDMRKNWGVMKEVYRDQLRFQRMAAVYQGSDSAGRGITDIAIPKNVPQDLNNMRRQMGMFGNMAASAGTQIVNLGKNIQWSGRQLTVGFTYPMAMFGAAAGVMAYKVEDAFGSINKVYDVTAKAQQNEALRTKELGDLRTASMDMAKKAAQDYGSAITDTLQIEQQLAATGMTMSDGLLDATRNVQRIAAIGDIDAGQTADMVVALGTAFKLSGNDMTDTLNYMNAASNATSLSLQDIAEAVPRAASSMSALGVSAKQMTVLLVSMREAGVDAAEGANALKSATGTILAPSPAALNFIKEVAGGDVAKGFENIAKTSGGNLYKAMEQMFTLTEGLSKLERQQVLVKLFGKYQFNRVSAMLDNLGGAFNGTQNQARKAMDLMGQSASENAEQAAKSLKDMTDTAAGRFRSAWETLKANLADLGKPFLEVAVVALQAASKVATFFNGMDDWKKKAILGGLALTALVGPAVMLVGLMMNLTGQFVKGVGSLAKWLGISTLVTKEQQAEALATEAANKAMMKQTQTAVTLTQEVRVLTAAIEASAKVAAQYAEVAGTGYTEEILAAERAATSVVENEAEKRAAMLATYEQQIAQAEAMASYGQFQPVKSPTVGAAPVAPIGKTVTDFRGASMYVRDEAATLAAQKAAEAEAAAINRANAARAEAVNKTNAQLAVQNKVKESVSGTSIAMGVMGAAMAATLVSSNEVVDSIAKWAMIGTMAVPAVQMVGGLATKMGSGIKDAVVAARAGTTGMTAMAGAMNVAKAGAVGFGAALNAALGPIGWITLGLTAAVGVFMAIKSHNDKMKAEQEALIKKQHDANVALEESTATIAENLGKAAGSWSQIANTNVGAMSGTGTGVSSTTMKSFNYYKSDEGKKALEAIDLSDESQVLDKINGQFIQLQVVGNMTAKQAADSLKGMLLAAGMTYSKATDMVEDVYSRLGNIKNIDWSKPITDQIDAINNAANGMLYHNELFNTGQGFANLVSDEDPEQIARIKEQATTAANVFNQALQNAANPNEARRIINQYMNGALTQWQSGFDMLMAETADGSDKVKDLFAQYGVTDGKTFADAFRNNADFKAAYEDMYNDMGLNVNIQRDLEAAAKSGAQFESTVLKPLADSSWYLSSGVDSVNGALAEFKENSIGLTADESIDNLMTQNQQYREYADAVARVNELKRARVPDDSPEMIQAMNALNSAGKKVVKQINEVNKAFGFAQGRTAAQALSNLLNHVKASAGGAEDKVKDVDKALDAMQTRKTVTITVKQVGGIVQTAMSNVQNAMADSAMSSFNAGWDSRMSAMQASQDRAGAALENSQQNAQDAFDARWERRKEAVEKAYDARIAAVQREIEAEQKAEEVRQRLFEKEKARLQAIADMENANIDFNTALNEGRLDDAAKTLNNAQVAGANDQMDAEQKAAEARAEARIKALEKKNDRLEKQRDKEIKQLEKMEERMRKHLERVQAAKAAALQKSQEQEMDSMQQTRDYEEAMLQQRLELFKAYTARNQKDLERWMKEVGLSYDDFGEDVKAKGEKWSSYFRKELAAQIRQAGTEVMNDNIWENVGKGIAGKLLKGLGFSGLADFRNFVRTGTMGGAGKNKGDETETHHTGGVVGSGGGSRGNLLNSQRGLHRTEQMVRAQKGEYIINRGATSKNRELLEAINSGSDVAMGGLGEVSGGASNGYAGPGGLIAGTLAAMYSKGIEKAFNNNYQVGLAKQQRMSAGGLFSGEAGMYGGLSLSAEQMKNAAIIATVGSGMGMSSRDLEIGIMTAITESMLRNVDYGDRDSLGLFQQRPSAGWGSPAQVTNPRYAAGKFFSALRGVEDRGAMSPWAAAQAVQRSAFSDGSNYQRWWGAAQAIFTRGLDRTGDGFSAGGGFVAGSGGRHRPINGPVTNGLHGGNSAGDPPAVDMAGPVGRPVYAVADGVITSSRDIAGPLPSDTYNGDGPYGSFGRMITMNANGASVLYAHLSRRSVAAGQSVKGGSVIGYSGNTGNSSGPHLHFGATNGPYAWLRRGGTVKYDNTPALLHSGESVLTKRLTDRFQDNVSGGTGGGDSYDMTFDFRGATIAEDVDIEKAVDKALAKRDARVGRKRTIK